MKHEVFWKNPDYIIRPELKENIECNYLIVGGGITGISAAYFLAKKGTKNIVLVEKNYIASGATGQAAGTLVLRGETDLLDLIKEHGKEKAERLWKEIKEELELIKKVIKEEEIECEAEEQDTLYCGAKRPEDDYLQKEYGAEKNLEPTTKFIEGEDFKKELNTDIFHRGFVSAGHGLSVNPLKLTQNLSKIVEKKYGVKIYENTSFLEAKDNKAKTQYGIISYKKLILAIDADHPSEQVQKNKSTIIITRQLTKDELKKTGMEKRKIVFDDEQENNYFYFKVTKEERMLFGFGNFIVDKNHKEINPHLPHFQELENFIKKIFPYLDLQIEYAWSGSFGVTKNYEPLIEFKDNMVSISGAGTQIACFMAAKKVVDKITKE
ncbi:MAG: FAD-binding oxidoreductase [Patescibacteria group bacterium]